MERKGVVTVMGTPVTLVGTEVKAGDTAPPFTVIDTGLQEVSSREFEGTVRLISATPSLDTPVCALQAQRFNRALAHLPAEVAVLNISTDLPFAISRFRDSVGIERVRMYSDHRDLSFGTAFGVVIRESRLLARAIFIIGKDEVVRYREIVPEITNHPDYDRALDALGKLLA